MKKSTLPILFAVLTMCGVSCGRTAEDTAPYPAMSLTRGEFNTAVNAHDGFYLVEESGRLALLVNGKTAEIMVRDTASGVEWRSNPAAREEDDIVGSQAFLEPQLVFKYLNNDTDQVLEVDTYADSVQNGAYSFEKINGGLRVIYEIGQTEKVIMAPKVISRERFERFVFAMEPDVGEAMTYYYRLLTKETISPNEQELYPSYKKHDIYVQNGDFSDFINEEISASFAAAGYTAADYRFDMEDNYVKEKTPPIHFFVAVEYTLTDNGLTVRIPKGSMQTQKPYYITQVSLLPFFGAGGMTDSGYSLIPDGSGALIRFNNEKSNYYPYSGQIYGIDRSIEMKRNTAVTESCYLPVFGIKNNGGAFVGIIEEGDALASINAYVSGMTNSYNYTYPSFRLNEYAVSDSFADVQTGTRGLNMFQARQYAGDITVRYYFLSGDEASYTGMARRYQEYLLKTGGIQRQPPGDSMPLSLDLLGMVDCQSSFLGFPVTKYKALTDYDEAAEILDRLADAGVENIVVRYRGASNDGLRHSLFDAFEPADALGGKKGYQKFIDYLRDREDITLYADADFLYACKPGMFDGFSKRSGAARYLTGEYAYRYDYNYADGTRVKTSFMTVIKPQRYGEYINRFVKSYDKYGYKALSVADMGTDLNSDFSKKSLTLRDEAQTYTENALAALREAGYRLITSGANAYTLSYVNFVQDVPATSSQYYLTDEAVPFYQIVLHGVMPFSMNSINLSSDAHTAFLKAIETGASLQFHWMYAQNQALKNTDYDLVGLNYHAWFERDVAYYIEANRLLADLQGSRITGHSVVQKGVYKTEYENQTVVYVNYSGSDVKVDGLLIKALEYVVVEAGQ